MKPIIGVVSRPDILKSERRVDIVYQSIRKIITELGGIPFVIIPPIIKESKKLTLEEKQDLNRLLSLCDGFVFQGGDNFYDYDLYVVDYAYQNNIPSLGICLGMQLMSVYKNGVLGKLNTNMHYQLKNYVHSIKIKENSMLASILKKEELEVNSRHHDYVIQTDLDIVATSTDVIEAVEDNKKAFFIGVQWHPEDMIAYDEVMKQLWSAFIAACRECSYESKGSDYKM